MSDFMQKWLRKGKGEIKKPPSILFPDPTKINDLQTAASVSAANDAVIVDLTSSEKSNVTTHGSSERKRKRSGQYGSYTPEIRLRIAKYCIDNGPARTSRHFSAELGWTVNESTVRNIKKILCVKSQKADIQDRDAKVPTR